MTAPERRINRTENAISDTSGITHLQTTPRERSRKIYPEYRNRCFVCLRSFSGFDLELKNLRSQSLHRYGRKAISDKTLSNIFLLERRMSELPQRGQACIVLHFLEGVWATGSIIDVVEATVL